MKKIFLYNVLVFGLLVFLIIIILSILNLTISGQPRYWEIVHGKNSEKMKIDKEKIVQIKRKSKKNDFLRVSDEKYKSLGYSGYIKNHNCGEHENGFFELIYQTDSNGFRENLEDLYTKSDFVLLGDSFTNSTCENKPNDLKSKLLDTTPYSYLNLGREGTDYAEQSLNIFHYTKNTNFNGLIWFFYEGNDYEQKSHKIKKIKNYKLYADDKIDYEVKLNHEISSLFRIKVWLAEFIRGASVVIKFFKKYDSLLDTDDYNKVHQDMFDFLNKKNIKKRYLVYIPSWQKLSLYKLKNLNLYDNHPQVVQLNSLKNNVKKISSSYGFKFVDTDQYFFDLENPLSVFHYELNTHFNPSGYEILAKVVTLNISN